MDNKEEIWKDVHGYEGYYKVSNMGNVISLNRTITYSNGRVQLIKERSIGAVRANGYRYVALSKNNVQKCTTIAQIVAVAFLGHKPDGHTFVVDHINGNRTDDRACNLRIVTNRDNNSYCYRSDRDSLSSKFTGVHWSNSAKKWSAQIKHKGISHYLGYFTTEKDAADCYQEALQKIKDRSFNPGEYKPKFSSKYKGVTFQKASSKWMARITINGKLTYLGVFSTEDEANCAYLKAEENETSFLLNR